MLPGDLDIAHSRRYSRLWKLVLKPLECVVDGTGEVVSEHGACRRQIYRPFQQKELGRTTAQQVANQLQARLEESRDLLKIRCQDGRGGGGLYARRPVVCVPLTRQQPYCPFARCREHHN
ncbi:hypothetical protein TNCV_2574081 [Trichonephila clavipes]|nr:hypothetical protein TNCV_2574081 [Trichonephila clavipes]